MADRKPTPKIDLRRTAEESDEPRLGMVEFVAIGLSLLWLALLAAFFVVFPSNGDPMQMILLLLSMSLPVAVIWMGAISVRNAAMMREQSEKLRESAKLLRDATAQQQEDIKRYGLKGLADKLDLLEEAQDRIELSISSLSSVRQPARQPLSSMVAPSRDADAADQGSLALGNPADVLSKPLDNPTLIRALNFPEDVDDNDGFKALRRALQDRKTAQLIQASQDVLTLLSQDGIYMDDLTPDTAAPPLWRRFAQGERGAAMAAIGGIRDRSSVALASGRMRQDTIFRDSMHHFLRRFDDFFSRFEKIASDEEIAEMTDTRTARAFMLLGRVAGTFN
ncbi:MAG: hypothetical protein HUJ27_15125 [Rhodobacteraceae bacterium]|nr:hypothetical protein [Paracoccaceae bacterium]